jgi:peptide/nickel transport system permease protein
MLTYVLRRLLAVPPMLLVISFLTFLLLKTAPADYFRTLEEDPTRTLAYVMRLRASAGLARVVPPAERKELGELEVLDPAATAESVDPTTTIAFDAEGRPLEAGELLDTSRARAMLGRFTHDGRLYRYDEDGDLYVMVGKLEGYFRWLARVITGDLGKSYSKNQPVLELIGERVWNTLILSLASLGFAWVVAIPLGVLAAMRPNSVIDHLCGLVAYFGLSIPAVFLAMLAILFAAYTGWFPVGNMRDLSLVDAGLWERTVDVSWHLVLPTMVIGITSLAGYMRQMRGEMVETLSKDYVRTARAKGLGPRAVLFKHALRNAINPLVTLFGFSISALLSGSFLVEVVMNWPGMARLVVDAIFAKDEPLVMASVLVATLLLMAGNLIADLLLGLVDPRIRLG